MIGALVLLLPVIAGCEAGTDAPTLEFHPANAGANTVFNGIRISDAFVLGAPAGSLPSGSSASMFLSLFNTGSGDDQLTGASAPGWATSVQLSGGTVSVPVNTDVDLSGPEPSVVLSNLTKSIEGGGAIPVTLDFQHAGSVTLEVPVQAQVDYFATYSPPPASPTPSATVSASASPKATKASKKASAKASATPTP
jgi:copper(I)-binding protein